MEQPKKCDKDESVAITAFFNFFAAKSASIVKKIDFDTVFVHYKRVKWMGAFIAAAHQSDIKIRANLITIDFAPSTPLYRDFLELFDVNVLKEIRMNVRLAVLIAAIRDTIQFKSCESFSLVGRWHQAVPKTFSIEDFFHFAKLDTKHVSWTPTDIH